MWDEETATEFIERKSEVGRSDVEAAQEFLLEQAPGAHLEGKTLAVNWANARAGILPNPIDLTIPDPVPQLEAYASHVRLRLSMSSALWRVIKAGIFIHYGSIASEPFRPIFNTVRGVGVRSPPTGLQTSYPEKVFRPFNHDDNDELNDADLYLLRLDAAGIHPGIEASLRSALSCIRHALYDPAVVMLGAAMEGAWIELGESLLLHARTGNTGAPGKTIETDQSIKKKIDAVCQLYEREDLFGALRKKTGLGPRELRSIAQWSDVVRESRNVLHWKVQPRPNNSYSVVSSLMLGALKQLQLLHRVAKTASSRRRRRTT